MPLHYQTEFRLGRRGRPIRRQYRGFGALLALSIDLCLSLIVGLVLLSLRLALFLVVAFLALTWQLAVAFFRMAVEVLLAPVRVTRGALRRSKGRPFGGSVPAHAQAHGAAKPEWVTLDEL